MLRATYRVITSGGQHVFYVIDWAEDIADAQKEQADVFGKEFMDSGPGYRKLMEESGFEDVSTDDVTDVYADVLERWIAEWAAESAAVSEVMGAAVFADRMTRRGADLTAVRQGLMKRFLVSGRKP